jgi:hypothetical protein
MTDALGDDDLVNEHSAPHHRLAVLEENEAAFRAWVHTGAGLVALSFVAMWLADNAQGRLPAVTAFALLLFASGMALIVTGHVRAGEHRRGIATGRFHPAGRAITVATVLALVIGVASLAMVWLLRLAPP